MSELKPVYETKVAHDGIFDFKDLYAFLYEWLKSLSYTVVENKYSEKIKATGKDIEVSWTCLRKLNDYFRAVIKVSIRTIKLTEVEVTEDGIKVKKNKGTVEIKFSSLLELDYDNKWEKSPITKFFRGIYDKYMIKKEMDGYEDQISEEVNESAEQVKAYLALEGKKS